MEIVWRLHLASAPQDVYDAIDSDDGRAGFWADSAREVNGVIDFRFAGGIETASPIIERKRPQLWVIEYFGTVASFEFSDDGSGATDLVLRNTGVDPGDYDEVRAGWLNVLLPLKAWVDAGVDLHNHDGRRTWAAGYVDG